MTDPVYPVTLQLSLASKSVLLGDFVVADVSLTNRSSKPVWLNGRLAVNREDDPPRMREVWILVVGPDGRDVPLECMKRLRPSGDEDYRLVRPKESVINQEILSGCYRFDKVGQYKLVAFYQDQNPEHPPSPDGAMFISELLQSAPVTLEVRRAAAP